uniref:C-type lectin domain-containing protein n=1 Tax=Panagrolaimus davidi TaxID=227884 RepID=A0A914P937_9BILA
MLAGTQDFHGSTVVDFWIGLTTLVKPPTWSWTDGSAQNFTEWAPTEPSNITAEACAAISTTHGSWSAQDCFKMKPYVCAVPKVPSPPAFVKCPVGWIYFQPTHSCFGLSYVQQTAPIAYNWTMAEELCIKLGGHLPSFHSVDEFNVINCK